MLEKLNFRPGFAWFAMGKCVVRKGVLFKMPFHCANKTIPPEISMSCDYLRLEGSKV